MIDLVLKEFKLMGADEWQLIREAVLLKDKEYLAGWVRFLGLSRPPADPLGD